MKVPKHRLLTAVAVFLFTSTACAETATGSPTPASNRQQPQTLECEVPRAVRMQYLLFLPVAYEKSTDRWPFILYLHGGSLRGDDIAQVKRLGLPEKVEGEPDFPFIVVSPQCHTGEIWTDVDALAAVLDDVARSHRVDPDRVYVTGHSMGGRGALYAAYKMPERFAAVLSLAPVSPVTAWAAKLASTPLWLFHGPNDQFTPLKEIEELFHATEAAGGHPKLTVLPERDHYILDVYDRPEIYEWLRQQRRNHHPVRK
ncbi:MAG TPA: alpha/beta fold hydrolase [Chthoniobacterales bacterium]|nr:alpha/beta fold hydrolase [Chthoniobacterales bacterium]